MSYSGTMWSKAKCHTTFHTPVDCWQRDRKKSLSCYLGFTKFLTTLESPVVFLQIRHRNHQNGPNVLWQGLWLTHCLVFLICCLNIYKSSFRCLNILPAVPSQEMAWFYNWPVLTEVSLFLRMHQLYNFYMQIPLTRSCGRPVIYLRDSTWFNSETQPSLEQFTCTSILTFG